MFAQSYRDPQGRFTVEVPAGWRAQKTPGGTILTHGDSAYVSIVFVPGGGQNQGLVKQVTDQIGAQWQQFEPGQHGSAPLAGHQGIFAFYSGVNPKGVSALMRVVAAPFGEDAWMLIVSVAGNRLDAAKAALIKIENSFAVGGRANPSAPPPAGRDTAPSGPLPPRKTPSGMQGFSGEAGGRLLTASVPGAKSAVAVVQSGLTHLRGYFDTPLTPLQAVTTADQHSTLLVFRATLGGQPVLGLATAAYDPEGHSHFAAAFDSPAHLRESLPGLMKQAGEVNVATLERERPKGAGKADPARYESLSHHVKLQTRSFPEGTATVGVAPGYEVRRMQGATFVAVAPDGSRAILYRYESLLDPRVGNYARMKVMSERMGRPFIPPAGLVVAEYDTDPISAWRKVLFAKTRPGDEAPRLVIEKSTPVQGLGGGYRGENLTGTIRLDGKDMIFTATILSGGPPLSAEGGWGIQETVLAAPVGSAETDMPALIAMQHSLHVNMKAVEAQTSRNIAQMQQQTADWLRANHAKGMETQNRIFESSMRNARASRDAMDKSTAGFLNYIRDTDVIEHTPSGGRATVDKNLASALEKADPSRFRTVPVSQYVKGVDYH